MLFDENRVDAIIHNWKNQVFSNERIHGVPLRHSTCLKPPIGGFRNLASRRYFLKVEHKAEWNNLLEVIKDLHVERKDLKGLIDCRVCCDVTQQ